MLEDAVELLSGEAVLRMLHTHEGAKVGCMVAAYGTPKDRKKLCKALKTHVLKAACDEFGYTVIIKLLSCVDDTQLTRKAVVSELVVREGEGLLQGCAATGAGGDATRDGRTETIMSISPGSYKPDLSQRPSAPRRARAPAGGASCSVCSACTGGHRGAVRQQARQLRAALPAAPRVLALPAAARHGDAAAADASGEQRAGRKTRRRGRR